MKKLSLGIALLLCLIKTDYLFSQDEGTPLHGLAAKVLFIDYSTPNNTGEFDLSNGLELSYLRNLGNQLAFGVPLKVGIANFPGDTEKSTFVSLDLIGQYQFTKPESPVIPYGFAGLGIAFGEFNENDVQIPVGLGAHFRVGSNSYVSLQGEYRKSFEDNRDNLQLGVGWYFRLKANPRPPEPLDSDQDGLPDAQDHCPDEPGTLLANGCPDTDEDGVPNGDDDCPTEKGPASNKGCPAPDDKDKDGVPDKEDLCPEVPGLVSEKGCPPANASSIDTDGDGVTDDKDQCPEVSGKIQLFGCPDRDGDGVADKDDRCPDEPGQAQRNGCPPKDTDKDGVLDEEDDCPEIPGKASTNGCPDRDGDGVGDAKDECPDQPGYASANGCPDADNDGVPDHKDRCPKIAGDPNRGGCPFIDTDGDTVADEDDQCPNERGNPDLLGCPDSDGDQIPDRVDKCPNEPGTAERNGCPIRDRDNDTVEDADDRCPDTPGSAKAQGCPDADDDGFGDIFDKCPNEPGTNQGCPDLKKEEKEFLAFAAKDIQFETGKASLTAGSYNTLDKVAEILKAYPRYHVTIGGHTDNVGNDENNRLLSEERAKVCYEYLISRGLPKERMKYKGFGETKPLADNKTEAGRLANRRVEFDLYLP